MGLDIGVVSPIEYISRPRGEVYEFAQYLTVNSEEADWSVWSEGNVIAEYTRGTMVRQMEEYIASENLVQDAVDRIRRWVEGLPWRGDMIMLHYNW